MSGVESSNLSDAGLSNAMNIAVAVKAQTNAKAQGQAVLTLLQSSLDFQQQVAPSAPRLGRRIDMRA